MYLKSFLIHSIVETARRIILFCLALLFLTTQEPKAEDKDRRKASFIPQWVPQAQFAGYYIAQEQGIYKKHGIDLTIIPGGPGKQPSDFLNDQKADFGTLWLTSG